MTLDAAKARSDSAIREIVQAYTEGTHPGVVVDSPPGAGKTRLVVHTASHLAAAGEQAAIIGQTNNQVDDIVDRLAGAQPKLAIGRLSKSRYLPTDLVARHRNVRLGNQLADLQGCQVIIGTAHKWERTNRKWQWAIIDEAYQMRSDMLLRTGSRFNRMLFVGDPGQLDPFSTVEDNDRWVGLNWDPMQSAVAGLLLSNPDLPQSRLPLSWRLAPAAATVVAPAFYPFTGFDAATSTSDRRMALTLPGIGGGPIDEAIHMAATTGWALYELPARNTIRTDAEAIHAVAAIAVRLLQRGTETYCENHQDGRRIDPGRIAVGATHRDQVNELRIELAKLDGEGIRVDTANRLQGNEFDVTVILHPLSGRRDATQFHLEAGRLCVLTSRHRHACIVVARQGIPELLDAHPSTEPMRLNELVKFPDGWEANQAVLAHLANHRIQAI